MKRSEINNLIKEAMRFFREMNFALPAFAYFTPEDWRQIKNEAREIFELGLGWDVTDFGSGDFSRTGLFLFTIRNGKPSDSRYPKPYAEKIMIAGSGQVTPMHFHHRKMEDIINRGGGDLALELFHSTSDEGLDRSAKVTVSIDGINRTLQPGEKLALSPGESICLPPGLYHKFYGEKDRVLIGEVSMVNDDAADNRFYEPAGRFPEIEEDERPEFLLCNDYEKFLK
ncbi:MAG: D-lyxose/D-mannose family sugar isomerase [Bacillota bacterium]